ncbi:MAG: hypothetical protein K0U47_08970 [Epsilonproteobacteria bacterium]|nr:hypothetical protein [Campylobacterota bacterium]
MKMPRKNQKEEIKTTLAEKSMLSLHSSGVYISTRDIVELGNKLEIELPYKTRRIILQKLFIEAKEKEQFANLVALISQMIDTKIQKLLETSQPYPSTSTIIQPLIQKANSTKMLLQRELRLNPYD